MPHSPEEFSLVSPGKLLGRWACWRARKKLASVGRTHQYLVPERSTVVLSIVRFQRSTRSLAPEGGFGQPVFHATGAAGADWQRPPVRQQVPSARNHSPLLQPHLPRARHRAWLHTAEPTLFLQRPSQALKPHDCISQGAAVLLLDGQRTRETPAGLFADLPHAKRSNTLRGLTPRKYGCTRWQKNAVDFNPNPVHFPRATQWRTVGT